MADIEQFLRYLERDDVTEIVFAEDEPVCVVIAGAKRPLTKAALGRKHVEGIASAPPFTMALPAHDDMGRPERVQAGGRSVGAWLSRLGGRLQLRVIKDRVGSATAPSPSARGPVTSPSPAPRAAAAPAATVRTPPRPAPASGREHSDTLEIDAARAAAAMDHLDPRALDLSGAPAPSASATTPSAAMRPVAAPPATAPRAAPTPTQPAASSPAASHGPAPAAAPQASTSPRTPPRARGEAPWASAEDPRRMLSTLLAEARARRASDVVVTSERPAAIRWIGALEPEGPAISHARLEQALGGLLEPHRRAQLDDVGYTDFAIDTDGGGRVRANVARHRKGIKGTFRLIHDHVPSLAELGLPAELAKVTTYHQGLAIISGPNGHGKTTTMAALVGAVAATRPVHVITVEDPIEVLVPRGKAVISQREVGVHTESFHRALKAALREDPDVIVIGELRDRETVEMALSAAETGHLVIATMSTPSGAKTIDRMIDLFPPDDQAQVRATLAGALKIVVSQRLIPRTDGRGMVAAAELITGNIALWSLIRDKKLHQLPSLMQRGRAFGMLRLEDSLRAHLEAGVIDLECATAWAEDPRLLKQGGLAADAPAPEPVSDSPSGIAGRLGGIFGKRS